MWIMQFRSKLFLALAVLFLGLSYTPFGSETLYDIPKPLGVIFFGLFLITWIFPRRDFDQFERDQALRKQLIKNERRARRHSRIRWKPRAAHPHAGELTSLRKAGTTSR